MSPAAIVIIIGGLAIFIGLVYVGLKSDNSNDPLQERLAQYGERELPSSLEDIELSLSFKDRVMLPLARKLAGITVKFTPQKQLEDARLMIDLAGLTMNPASFFAMRVGVTVGFTLLAFLVFFVLSASTAKSSAAMYTVG